MLNDFISIMKSYKVDAYRAYTTSAIREAKNRAILLDYLEKKTGLKIEVLDNAEQRFLDYKSIAAQANEFNRIIEKGTAILDVGGGSVQVSLFDKDSLVATQNIRIGNLRIRGAGGGHGAYVRPFRGAGSGADPQRASEFQENVRRRTERSPT